MMRNTKTKQSIIIGLLLLAAGIVIFYLCKSGNTRLVKPAVSNTWHFPDTNTLASTAGAELIRYGRELIINTAAYLGPKGIVKHISNGMNCGNCHLEAGTRLNGNCFAMVASTYPKFRNRSGKLESIEYRVNDCMERSLNGKKLDSLSREMKAMVAYIKWLGKDVPKNVRLKGIGIPEVPLLKRAASVDSGGSVYLKNCSRCHGANEKRGVAGRRVHPGLLVAAFFVALPSQPAQAGFAVCCRDFSRRVKVGQNVRMHPGRQQFSF